MGGNIMWTRRGVSLWILLILFSGSFCWNCGLEKAFTRKNFPYDSCVDAHHDIPVVNEDELLITTTHGQIRGKIQGNTRDKPTSTSPSTGSL